MVWFFFLVGVLLPWTALAQPECVPTVTERTTPTVSWRPSVLPASLTFARYVLEQQIGDDWMPLPVAGSVTSMVLPSLSPGTYAWRVRTEAMWQGRTVVSDWASPGTPPPCVTVVDAPPLPAPVHFAATAEGDAALLTWTLDDADQEVHLEARTPPALDWSLLAIVFGTRYRDRGYDPLHGRCYRAQQEADTPASWTADVCLAGLVPLPPAVVVKRLPVTPDLQGLPPITLTWDPPASGAVAKYQVKRASGSCPVPPKPMPLTVVSVDSEEAPGWAKANAVDPLPQTMWHTQWQTARPPLPHQIILDAGSVAWLSGLTYLPRQDGNLNGTIGRYQIFVSLDGTTWGQPVATGTWARDASLKQVTFPGVEARYVKLVAQTEVNAHPSYTAVAGLTVLGAEFALQPWIVVATTNATTRLYTEVPLSLPACWHATAWSATGQESPKSNFVEVLPTLEPEVPAPTLLSVTMGLP